MGQFYNAYSENEREKIKYPLFTLLQHKYQPKIWNVSSCTSFWHYLSTFYFTFLPPTTLGYKSKLFQWLPSWGTPHIQKGNLKNPGLGKPDTEPCLIICLIVPKQREPLDKVLQVKRQIHSIFTSSAKIYCFSHIFMNYFVRSRPQFHARAHFPWSLVYSISCSLTLMPTGNRNLWSG